MKKRLQMILSVALLLVVGIVTASAQSATAVANVPNHGLKIGPEQRKAIGAFQKIKPASGFITPSNSVERVAARSGKATVTHRTSPSGAYIQGWHSSSPSGWYELQTDGAQNLLWTYDGDNEMTTGCLRNGKIVGFSCQAVWTYVFVTRMVMSLDGNLEESEDLNMTDYSRFVMTMTYDADNDKYYAYTLNTTGDGYMIQSIDPTTYDFTPLVDNVNYEDVGVSLAWNPNDGQLYAITPARSLVKINPENGEITKVMSIDMSVSSSYQGMTFSPKDNAFVWASLDNNYKSAVYLIDPVKKTLTKTADLGDMVQYSFLVTTDKPINADAPARPTLDALDFANGATSGTAKVTLPTKTYNGDDLTGNVDLIVKIDSDKYTQISGAAGSQVTVNFSNLAEGQHEFRFIASKDGNDGPEAYRKYFVGYDTPVAPDSVKLEQGKASWKKVTAGVNNGYIDSDNLTYNVYIDNKKLNSEPISDTTFEFEMPDTTYSALVVGVEAVNHGHASDKGFSNSVNYGKPYELPVSIFPQQSQAPIFTIVDGNNDDRTWRYYQWTRSFDIYSPGSDDWLILPMINIPTSDKAIGFTFDVKTNWGTEKMEVAYGTSPDPSTMNIIDNFSFSNNEDYESHTSYFSVPQTGTYYLALHSISDDNGSNIDARNFNVAISEKSISTPAAPTNITTKPGDKGALNATVSFTMPSKTIGNTDIPASKTLKAYAVTAKDTVTAEGKPGATVSLTLNTKQGFNDFTVYAADGNAEGLHASARQFTGFDAPMPPVKIYNTTSEDNMTAHFYWDEPTVGQNGGYVDPSTLTYYLCTRNEYNEMAPVKDLGSATECDTTVAAGTKLRELEVGITVSNSYGQSDYVRTGSAAVGIPYTLPMYEKFSQGNIAYTPLTTELPDESYSYQWGLTMYTQGGMMPEDSVHGYYMYGMGDEGKNKGLLMLPKFSTIGIDNPIIELNSFYFDNAAPVKVLAETYGVEPTEIGSFNDSGKTGWNMSRIALPDEFKNRPWVALHLETEYENSDKYLAIQSYRIRNLSNNDYEVSDATVDNYLTLGDTTTISASVQNIGATVLNNPDVVCEISKDGKLMETLKPEATQDGNMAVWATRNYTFKFVPTTDMLGNIDVAVRANTADDDMTNNVLTDSASVVKENAVTVTDLKATSTGNGVQLSWTNPEIKYGYEDFEDFAPFTYGSHIGDFTNIDGDGAEVVSFAYWSFPYAGLPKAWQVLNGEEINAYQQASGTDPDPNFLQPYEGKQCIGAFRSLDGTPANDWLISPEVKGGTELSFMMSNMMSGYETAEVLYSTTDADTASFLRIEKIEKMAQEWVEHTYTLPADARYFAIRYTGSNEDGMGVLLDNIYFTPAASKPVLAGFDIYRNGTLIAENVKPSGTYTDASSATADTYYNIVPVLRIDGKLVRQPLSNTAFVDSSTGINNIPASANGTYNVYTIDGKTVRLGAKSLNGLKSGLYIVNDHKVIVK